MGNLTQEQAFALARQVYALVGELENDARPSDVLDRLTGRGISRSSGSAAMRYALDSGFVKLGSALHLQQGQDPDTVRNAA